MEKESFHHQYEIYDSVLNINPEELNQIVDPGKDLAMDQRLIALTEKTLANQAKFWTVVFRDRTSRILACANLSLFDVDIVQSAPAFLQKWTKQVRLIWPNALKWKVLFCGLPIPSGHAHLRFLPGVEPRPILVLLNKLMHDLARQQGAQLITFKEFDIDQSSQMASLKELGFICGGLSPLFILPGRFKNFTEYLAGLRSNYRHQIRMNVKKFNQLNLKVEHMNDPDKIKTEFTEQVYQLYLNIWERAKERLECLPIQFFQELAHAMPKQVSLTLISDANQPIAFAMGLIGDEIYYNIYSGMDYSKKDESDLYFNLFYQELDYA